MHYYLCQIKTLQLDELEQNGQLAKGNGKTHTGQLDNGNSFFIQNHSLKLDLNFLLPQKLTRDVFLKKINPAEDGLSDGFEKLAWV